MSPADIILLARFAIEFGIDAAQTLQKFLTRPPSTPPTEAEWDAFWSSIKFKTEQQYVDEARARLAGTPPIPVVPIPAPPA